MASFSNFKSTIVEASNTAAGVTAGVTVYATRADLPTSGNAGDQAYVTENNRLYIWNGSGWYNIALINLAPSIQSVLDSDGNTTPFSLANGVATTITITATDSDGDLITYTAEADSDFNGLATISQADNVFTITPFSSDSATTEFGTITFKADDGVNIASSGVQTFTLTFLSELWDETVLSIGTSSTDSLDNSTFIDRSTNAHTVTPTGTPVQTAFHPYLDNWSVEFDGTGDYLTAPTSTDFSFDGDFTVESWVYLRSISTSSHICDFRLGSNPPDNNNIAVAFSFSTGTFVISIQDINAVIGTTTVLPNQWYHVAAVRNSNTITLYVNGLSEDSVVNGNTFANYTNRPALGAFGSGAANLNGYISNFRVIKGTALYTADFTPSTEKLTAVSGTSLLTCQSNRFIDNSTNAHAITVNGDPEVSAFNPFGQESEYAVGENKGSGYFDGSAQNLIPSSTIISADGQFCIESWVYVTQASDEFNTIYGQYASGVNGRFFVGVSTAASVDFTGSGSSDFILFQGADSYGGGTVKLNSWQHVVFTRDSSNILRIFVDGIMVFNRSFTVSLNQTNPMIGFASGLTNSEFNGNIADLKIIDGSIPVQYQTSSTTNDTAIYTPPTAPVGNTNASLYLPMDNAGIFDKTGNHTLTLGGDASTSTTQTKYADTAMYFDGSGDYIRSDEMLDTISSTSTPFTIECWVYPLIAGGTAGDSADFIGFNRASDGNNILTIGVRLVRYNGANLTTTADLSLNQWSHIAFVYDGSSAKYYINGNLHTSSASAISTPLSSCVGLIGAEADAANGGTLGNYFNGYLENLQILKGVAKYATNFTPPNRTQGRTYQATS